MFPEPSALRAKLASGRCVTGTAIYSASPHMVEAAAFAGVDFIRIDSEHAWRRDESMDHMVRAALLAGATPIIRLDRDDPYLVRKALEIGAGGVVISNVASTAEACAIAAAARFPPLGLRGVGTLCLSGRWGGVDEAAWVAWSNREPLVGVMIESAVAVADIDAIMATDGIDFALFGPADFAMSLPDRDPAAIAARRREALVATARAARGAGKHMMYNPGLDDALIDDAVALGVDMIEFSHDVIMVRTALSAKVQSFGQARSIAPQTA